LFGGENLADTIAGVVGVLAHPFAAGSKDLFQLVHLLFIETQFALQMLHRRRARRPARRRPPPRQACPMQDRGAGAKYQRKGCDQHRRCSGARRFGFSKVHGCFLDAVCSTNF
jgi:hypothetical protein